MVRNWDLFMSFHWGDITWERLVCIYIVGIGKDFIMIIDNI
jgi:hypothetical protein